MDLSLVLEIEQLKKLRNAIILAHNYQSQEIQEIADVVGDSFALSRAAFNAKEEVIVFCGVRFMGETAKILSPEKTVLLPVKDAGCPMADMITAEQLRKAKGKYPNAAVVCYVNSSAEVKAESDVCTTSSNAIEIVKGLEGRQILFVPDQNLGSFVAQNVPDKEVITWDGFCKVHHSVTDSEVLDMKKEHPKAKLLIHPECKSEVLAHADFIGSTSEIIKYVQSCNEIEYIIGTEEGILTALQKSYPHKIFYSLSSKLLCKDMKKIRLEDVKKSLNENTYEVKLSEEVLRKARKPLDRMLNITKG